MNYTNLRVAMIIGTLFAVGAMAAAVSGCRSAKKQEANPPAASQPQGKHEAHHGGCLNAIETCAVGHAEVKIEGDVLRCWLVGGEGNTDKSIRVTDPRITLAVTPEGGAEKTLVLEARPNELAEETVGDCSCFEGKAPWLAGVKKFDAVGTVNLKGQPRPIKIEYPDGYDPD